MGGGAGGCRPQGASPHTFPTDQINKATGDKGSESDSLRFKPPPLPPSLQPPPPPPPPPPSLPPPLVHQDVGRNNRYASTPKPPFLSLVNPTRTVAALPPPINSIHFTRAVPPRASVNSLALTNALVKRFTGRTTPTLQPPPPKKKTKKKRLVHEEPSGSPLRLIKNATCYSFRDKAEKKKTKPLL